MQIVQVTDGVVGLARRANADRPYDAISRLFMANRETE